MHTLFFQALYYLCSVSWATGLLSTLYCAIVLYYCIEPLIHGTMYSLRLCFCLLLLCFKLQPAIACYSSSIQLQLQVHSTSVPCISSFKAYSKSRVAYYSNSCATFQCRLLVSGDINPNPGPTAHCHNGSERLVYDRSTMLRCNPVWNHLSMVTIESDLDFLLHKFGKSNRGTILESIWETITQLNIQAPQRGRRGGRRK